MSEEAEYPEMPDLSLNRRSPKMPLTDHCPYCHSSRSILMGHVYCSREKNKMTDLETGTLFIHAKKLEETFDHVSRLSIRCMLNGNQYYKLGSHEALVTPKNYLVVNQGQHYKTSFESNTELEMILVAFKPGFAEGLLHSLVTSEDELLDDPFTYPSQPITFFETTYDEDAIISNLIARLRKLIDEPVSVKEAADVDSIYSVMLTRLLFIHRRLKRDINQLTALKYSTRAELFRRLHVSRDFIDAHVCERISLIEISKVACLSVHHFKRSFQQLFGVTPHKYLVRKRIEKAEQLLINADLKVEDVCTATGFENTSSFIRLFRQYKGTTPGNFRLNSN